MIILTDIDTKETCYFEGKNINCPYPEHVQTWAAGRIIMAEVAKVATISENAFTLASTERLEVIAHLNLGSRSEAAKRVLAKRAERVEKIKTMLRLGVQMVCDKPAGKAIQLLSATLIEVFGISEVDANRLAFAAWDEYKPQNETK